jgi:uncharacterized iron-regulated membrane protein
MTRKLWFVIHRWAGLQFSLLLCFILVTGTIATISRDIDWLLNPAIRAPENAVGKQINWSAILHEAQTWCPTCRLEKIVVSTDSWFNVETLASSQKGERFRIFHARDTGKVTGTGNWFNVQQTVRQMHRHLMLHKQTGITIVCFMVVPLLVALISSINVYKQWYRKFFQWPTLHTRKRVEHVRINNTAKSNRKLWSELHKFIGIWSLWFIALLVVTGTWYLVEIWGLKASYPAETPQGFIKSDVSYLQPEQLNRFIAIAKKTYPALQIHQVSLPTKKQPYVVLSGQAEAILVRDRANQIAFDVETEEILSVNKGDALGIHARISEAADPLHFGQWGGGITRWIWFIFGVMLSGIAISGMYLWANRQFAIHALDNKSYIKNIWLEMGWMKWPIFALLIICFAMTILTLTNYN